MTLLRSRSSLFIALSLALAMAGCSSDEPTPTDSVNAPAQAQPTTQAETAQTAETDANADPLAVEPEITAPVEPAVEEVPLNPMDRPIQHEALSFSLHSHLDEPALEPTAAYDQMWLPMEEGSPIIVCMNNHATQPALVSLSVQGRNLDFEPAHPTHAMWRVDGQTSRCLSAGGKDQDYPAVVAWNAFFFAGEGGDGSRIEDVRAPAASSGFIRLEEPSQTPRPNAWPALEGEDQAQESQSPVPTPSQPQAPAEPVATPGGAQQG